MGRNKKTARYEVFHGDYEKLFDLPDDLDAVTAERLREVAKAVFRTNNMTVGVLQAPAAEVAE